LKNRSVKREEWDGKGYLEPSMVGELNHWTRKLKVGIQRKIVKDIAPKAIIITDAAPSGWGARIVELSKGKTISQNFSKWMPPIYLQQLSATEES
jgi:hypothetical protein